MYVEITGKNEQILEDLQVKIMQEKIDRDNYFQNKELTISEFYEKLNRDKRLKGFFINSQIYNK